MDIRQVVDDPEWQALRASLVGTWKRTPQANVERLRAYGGDLSCPFRLRRLHNYLTGSGFRLGVIGCPEADALLAEVRAARDEIRRKGDDPTLAARVA